jgi:hypothetical protein
MLESNYNIVDDQVQKYMISVNEPYETIIHSYQGYLFLLLKNCQNHNQDGILIC